MQSVVFGSQHFCLVGILFCVRVQTFKLCVLSFLVSAWDEYLLISMCSVACSTNPVSVFAQVSSRLV